MRIKLTQRILAFLGTAAIIWGLIGPPEVKADVALPYWEGFEDGVANDFNTLNGN